MTNKEAIFHLRNYDDPKKVQEAFTMAIDVLEQTQLAEGDRAISLNAVIGVMYEMWGDSGELLDAIKELPPVTPQRLKGQWERMSEFPIEDGDRFKCSCCGNVVHYKSRINLYTFNLFCGRCGSYNGGDDNEIDSRK